MKSIRVPTPSSVSNFVSRINVCLGRIQGTSPSFMHLVPPSDDFAAESYRVLIMRPITAAATRMKGRLMDMERSSPVT
jgi:hypothetical protein